MGAFPVYNGRYHNFGILPLKNHMASVTVGGKGQTKYAPADIDPVIRQQTHHSCLKI